MAKSKKATKRTSSAPRPRASRATKRHRVVTDEAYKTLAPTAAEHAAHLRRDLEAGRYALLAIMAQSVTDAWLARPMLELARCFRAIEAVAVHLESEARS